MHTDESFKEESKKQWTSDPCGYNDVAGVPEETLEFYDAVDKARYENYGPWMKGDLDFDKFSGKKLLEIGFGMGTDLSQFAKNGAVVYGVDLSPTHLKIAQKRFELLGLKADLRLADVENLPFEDEQFDAVYTFGVIHHTPGTQQAIDEIHRVLKKGGKAVIAVYYKYSIFNIFAKFLSEYILDFQFFKKGYRAHLSTVEHTENSDAKPLVKVYGKREFKKMLAGFKDVNIICNHLEKSHFGKFKRFIPGKLFNFIHKKLSRKYGWYIIAKCVK